MTDATTPEQPRRAAVLALLRHENWCPYPTDGSCPCSAGQALIDLIAGERQEAQTRPAAASEGLRAALEDSRHLLDPNGVEWVNLADLRAALASDTGRSVGALDVERLARAMGKRLTALWWGSRHAIAAAYDAERQGGSE